MFRRSVFKQDARPASSSSGLSSQLQRPVPGIKFLPMHEMGKFLVIAGVMMAAVGAILWYGFGRNWMGRLPGDIHYARGNFSFYFPVVTCLLASLVLTLLLWLFKK